MTSSTTCQLTFGMGVFDSKPLNTTLLNNRLRKNPLLFGVPFMMIMVVASYALVPFAQTKYELQDRRISKVRLNLSVLPPKMMSNLARHFQVSREQELGLENRRRKFDIREEYFASVSFPIPSSRSLRLTFPASRNSARRLPKIGSPNVSNVQPEHLNGAYHHLNPHRSGHDPFRTTIRVLIVRCSK